MHPSAGRRALLALACVACAAALELPTCPANGATSCLYGLLPLLPPTPVPIRTMIDMELAGGLPYQPGDSGVCSTLTYVCNAGMATLYGDLRTRAQVAGVAAAGCLNTSVTPPAFMQNERTFVAFGAFIQTDCVVTTFTLAFGLLDPALGAALASALPSMTVCNTSNCNVAPPPAAPLGSGALRGAAAGAALGAAALALLALA
jgi:hypothetical protein